MWSAAAAESGKPMDACMLRAHFLTRFSMGPIAGSSAFGGLLPVLCLHINSADIAILTTSVGNRHVGHMLIRHNLCDDNHDMISSSISKQPNRLIVSQHMYTSQEARVPLNQPLRRSVWQHAVALQPDKLLCDV